MGDASPMAPDDAVDPLGRGTTVWGQAIDPAKTVWHAAHVDASNAPRW